LEAAQYGTSAKDDETAQAKDYPSVP